MDALYFLSVINDSIKEELVPKSDFANRVEKYRIQEEIKKYDKVNFENLKTVETLEVPDGTPYKLKIMSNDVLRLRFEPTGNKAYHRIISILKYLDKCDLVPRLLYFDNDRYTIYLPYYGNLLDKNQEKSLGLLLRKLKRNWGVYLVKDRQVQNTLPTNSAMIRDKRVWLFDFSSPDWIVDRDRPYPMIN
jgi:hypothetical protein